MEKGPKNCRELSLRNNPVDINKQATKEALLSLVCLCHQYKKGDPPILADSKRMAMLLAKLISNTNRGLIQLAAVVGLGLMLAIVYEVISRFVFQTPTVWALEISEYLLLWLVFVSIGYTTLIKAHVRVELIVIRLPKKVQAICGLISSIIGFIYSLFLTWAGWRFAWQAYQMHMTGPSQIAVPLFPILIIIPIGACLFCLQFLVQIGGEIAAFSKYSNK